MSASLNATMQHRSITAVVDSLNEEHKKGRTFKWYLDKTLLKTEVVMDEIESRECTFYYVPYISTHTVSVTILDAKGEEEYDSLSTTVTDSLKLWDWTKSNGIATAEQTQTSYTSATTQGLAANFSYKVWDDLVDTASDVVILSEKSWNAKYAKVADTKMGAANEALTEKRFNSIVANLPSPYPYWLYQSGRTGYLGRTAVRGAEKYGAELADIVYGAYLLEIAHLLNVSIDAIGEFNAGFAKLLKHSAGAGIYTIESLRMRSPSSRRLSIDDMMFLETLNLRLRAPQSRLLSRSGSIWTADSLRFRASPSKHLPITNRNRSYRSFDLIAQNERPLHSTVLMESLTDILLYPSPSTLLSITRGSEIGANVTLSTAATQALAAAAESLTATNIVLDPAESLALLASIFSASGIDTALATPPSEPFAISALSGSDIAAELLMDETAVLALLDAMGTGASSIRLSPSRSKALSITETSAIEAAVMLAALNSARLAHTGGSATDITAALLSLTSSKLAHTAETSIGSMLLATLIGSPSSVLAHTATEALGSVLSAPLRVPGSGRLAHTASESLTTVLSAAINDDPSAVLAADLVTVLEGTESIDLAPAESKHMAAELTAPDGTADAVLAPAESSQLAAEILERMNDTVSAVLTPVDGEPLTVSTESASTENAALATSQAAVAAHTGAENSTEAAALTDPESAKGTVVSVCITVLAAALEARPKVEPTSDWAEQEGTNLDIRRTYCNRVDDDDSTLLLIDQAWYQEPVQVGTNLAITSEGYNDYGLEGDSEDTV